MSHVQVYDRAMCCSTGICGPQVDPVLPKFAADLEWLKQQGHTVDRFNLAQEPAEFAASATVQKVISDEGVECLPLILVDGQVVSRKDYPSRESLATWTATSLSSRATLPMADGGCCGDSGCC